MPDKTIPALWQNTLDQTAATIPPGATLSHAPTGGGGGGGGSGTVTSIDITSTAGTITPTGGPITTAGSINVEITGLPTADVTDTLGASSRRWVGLVTELGGDIAFDNGFGSQNQIAWTDGTGPTFANRSSGKREIFNISALTADRTATWQNSSGTVAWLTDIPAAGVTSVALALPSSTFTVSGSPVTSTGTLTGTFATQTANTVLAGPTTGSAATPTWRALVAADIPAVSPSGSAGGDLSGTYPNPTVAKINTVALGTTTATAGNLLIGSGTAWVTNPLTGDLTITSAGVGTAAATIQRTYYASSTSGTSTYTATLSPVPTAYQTGAQYVVTITSANTGASTMNFNSLGAKTMQLNGAALTVGQLQAGATYQMVYDGTNLQISGQAVATTSPLTTKG